MTMHVRPLGIDEIDSYLRLLQAVNAESGVDGVGHSHAYSRINDPYNHQAACEREVTRWSSPTSGTDWRRGWGLFDQEALVGHVHAVGGSISTELHRISMGMGILCSHHRQGGGTLLLQTIITWAQEQPHIDWLDLGVFADNEAAQALYLKHGFQILGRTPDRFRVDGQTLDDIAMTLPVAQVPEA